ncbi:MAG: metal-dependent hydrolase [Acidobacteria bacterium]|nr:metal-dependent hydrolase [Acidobacteriota bacterium]
MDNVTHSLLAVVLAHSGLNRGLDSADMALAEAPAPQEFRRAPAHGSTAPAVTMLLIVASNAPDIDAVAALFGRLSYLEHHRGYTHTYWGILLLALVLPLPFLIWNRSVRSAGLSKFNKYGLLLLVALLGTFSHLLVDFTNAYGIRPSRPFSQRWLYGDFIPIIDPWIYLILGSAAFLITSRGRLRLFVWTLGIAAASMAVLSFGRQWEPDPMSLTRGVWFAVLVAVLLVWKIAGRRLQEFSRLLAMGSMALLSGYCMFCWYLHDWAVGRVKAEFVPAISIRAADAQGRVAAYAVPGNPLLWRFVVDTPDLYYSGFLEPVGRRTYSVEAISKNFRGLAFRRAMETCSGQVMMRFARFPYVRYQPDPEGWVVTLSDLRFAPPLRPDGFGSEFIHFDWEWRERPKMRPLCPWSENF